MLSISLLWSKEPSKSAARLGSADSNSDSGDQQHEVVQRSGSAQEERASGEKWILTKNDTRGATAYDWSTSKKWFVLSVVFLVQCSMNFNAAIYASGVSGISRRFDISEFQSRLGQFAFLVAYAFGCELWAPFSEEFGRWPVMQISLWLVTISQVPCALAPNYGVLLFGRILGGLSSAGGSVTLGIVADMYEPAWQQYALTYIVFASCAGSVLAPPPGGVIETYLKWQWVFAISGIFSFATALVHFFSPETRPECLLDVEAKRRRKTDEDPNVYGPFEIQGRWYQRLQVKNILMLMYRPYKMLFTEPIVFCLSLLSGFSDALIFTGLNSVGMVLSRWNFSKIQVGLAFIALLGGYLIASLTFIPVYRKDRQIMQGNPNAISPERRLWWLLYTVPLMPLGLLGFGWTSLGPDSGVSWAGPVFFMILIGIANLAIYQATIDYMVAAYGPYAASATGGNGFCRDFLAGLAALYATPLYTNIDHGSELQYAWPTMILFGIGLLLVIPVYVFYFKGEWVRSRSKLANEIRAARERELDGAHGSAQEIQEKSDSAAAQA